MRIVLATALALACSISTAADELPTNVQTYLERAEKEYRRRIAKYDLLIKNLRVDIRGEPHKDRIKQLREELELVEGQQGALLNSAPYADLPHEPMVDDLGRLYNGFHRASEAWGNKLPKVQAVLDDQSVLLDYMYDKGGRKEVAGVVVTKIDTTGLKVGMNFDRSDLWRVTALSTDDPVIRSRTPNRKVWIIEPVDPKQMAEYRKQFVAAKPK